MIYHISDKINPIIKIKYLWHSVDFNYQFYHNFNYLEKLFLFDFLILEYFYCPEYFYYS